MLGFEVTEESLAVEVISSAMNSSHNFLGQKHTLRYLRGGEVLLTALAERGSWENWDTSGRMGMAERAQCEAEQILNNHQVPPLSADQERELDEILSEANRKLKRI
jgi:trimethylamine:corrinoid methyltransferase-like protein